MMHPINKRGDQNQAPAGQGGPQPGTNAEPAQPGSVHEGDMLALFADGSVRFIPETIEKGVKTRLSYMDDGQAIGEF